MARTGQACYCLGMCGPGVHHSRAPGTLTGRAGATNTKQNRSATITMNPTHPDTLFTQMPDGQTRLLGVIGHPVHHTLSPAMHNPALAWLGLNMRYLAFPVHPEKLADAVRGFVAMGMRGFNATVPHKEALVPLMDWIDPLAQRIGAINTVSVEEDGTLKGYNTDAQGFTDALAEVASLAWESAPVLVLGAGGAARGVVAGLLEAGAKKIVVANRTLSRATQLTTDLGHYYPQADLSAIALEAARLPLEETGLLVNTTLLGLDGETIQMVAMNRLPPHAIVYDIVYAPQTTPLLCAAEKQGLATLDGLGMLLHQGARAFKIWTQQTMPVARVKKRLLASLAQTGG